jgi:4-hydroxy-tetrahydrodipicolinate synthase
MKKFEGVLVPLVTPFNRDGEVDEKTLREFVDYLIGKGIHGLVPTGSTGQGPLLLHEERKQVIKIVIDQANGRVPVLAGTGCVGTKETVVLSKYAEDSGADGLLIVAPFYNLLSEREIFEHYKMIANSVDIPITVYNNPAITKLDMKPHLLAELGEAGCISSVKESSGYLQRVTEIIRLSHGKVSVYSGSDDTYLDSFKLGAVGWVSATANIVPAQAAKIFELAVRQRNYREAEALSEKIQPLGELVESGGRFAQYVMLGVELTFGKNIGDPRMPLLPLTQQEKMKMRSLVEEDMLVRA